MRFELTTLTLARLCSTPELRPRSVVEGQIVQSTGPCKGENQCSAAFPCRFSALFCRHRFSASTPPAKTIAE
jgi:hypothetical protein